MAKPCNCGSGLTRRELRDARNIFCAFVCDRCEAAKRRTYRADIFTDPSYPADDLGDDTDL
jgi:hypothetical protein